jgi:hypothetical protein
MVKEREVVCIVDPRIAKSIKQKHPTYDSASSISSPSFQQSEHHCEQ